MEPSLLAPSPLSPSPVEVVLAVAAVVAVVFAGYAAWKVAKREWPVGFALTLVVLTVVVPFSGPVIAASRAWWLRGRAVSQGGRA